MKNRTRRVRQRGAKLAKAQREDYKHKRRLLAQRLKTGPSGKTPRVRAQIDCHNVFDRLWCGPHAPIGTREAAYDWLAQATGLPRLEAHIANLDVYMCRAVISKIKREYPQLF